jgi:hypothetical protein
MVVCFEEPSRDPTGETPMSAETRSKTKARLPAAAAGEKSRTFRLIAQKPHL